MSRSLNTMGKGHMEAWKGAHSAKALETTTAMWLHRAVRKGETESLGRLCTLRWSDSDLSGSWAELKCSGTIKALGLVGVGQNIGGSCL